jgi:hypothetical protein
VGASRGGGAGHRVPTRSRGRGCLSASTLRGEEGVLREFVLVKDLGNYVKEMRSPRRAEPVQRAREAAAVKVTRSPGLSSWACIVTNAAKASC